MHHHQKESSERTMRTFSVFRNPVTRPVYIVVFENFLLARAFAREHPELIEDEVEAENQAEAREKIALELDTLQEQLSAFVAPYSDDRATPADLMGF